MCWRNAKVSQLIEIHKLLANPKVKVDSSDLSDNNQIEIFNILGKSIFLFYNNGRLMSPMTLFGFFQFN